MKNLWLGNLTSLRVAPFGEQFIDYFRYQMKYELHIISPLNFHDKQVLMHLCQLAEDHFV